MFSIFKKRSTQLEEETFKLRVESFWIWFAENAGRFTDTIDAGKCASLSEEVSAATNKLWPEACWEFSAAPSGQGHSFTLTAEGYVHRQFLALYWLSQAPEIAGWTFFPSRQPSPEGGHRLEFNGRRFDPHEFWVVAEVDGDREKIDVALWHPNFQWMDEQEQYFAAFLFFDQMLGEFGTQRWIGAVTLQPAKLAEAIPIRELPALIASNKSQRGWSEGVLGETAQLLRFSEPHNRFPRGDIVTCSSMNVRLIEEYLAAEGQWKDPLAQTGADYVYLSFPAATLPKGGQVDARGKIEDRLDASLKEARSGRLIGGALGVRCAYIDLLIFDGARSLELVGSIATELKLRETRLEFFAKDKRGQAMAMT